MKNIIKRKICFALMALLTASSCGITQNIVWGPKYYDEKFKGFGLKEGEKIILIGEKFDYIFEDEKRLMNKIILTKEIQKINFYLGDSYFLAKGSEFARRLDLAVKAKDLSESQIGTLKLLGFQKMNSKRLDQYYFYTNIKGIRVNKTRNPHQIILPIYGDNQNYEGVIDNPTPLQIAGKVLLTPLAIAADIILMPITLPYTIYRDYKTSHTDYYCQGEFCGFDKVKNSSKNQKSGHLK